MGRGWSKYYHKGDWTSDRVVHSWWADVWLMGRKTANRWFLTRTKAKYRTTHKKAWHRCNRLSNQMTRSIKCTKWKYQYAPNGSTSMHQVEVPDAPDVPKEVQDVPEIPNGSARDTKWKYQIWEIPDGAISWTQMNSDVFVFFEKWEWRSYSVLLQ